MQTSRLQSPKIRFFPQILKCLGQFSEILRRYGLFRHLIDSNGIVDESVLEKLRLNIRSLIASQEEDSKDLLDLCIDVIYHNNMKAFGLQQLIKLYLEWLSKQEPIEEES